MSTFSHIITYYHILHQVSRSLVLVVSDLVLGRCLSNNWTTYSRTCDGLPSSRTRIILYYEDDNDDHDDDDDDDGPHYNNTQVRIYGLRLWRFIISRSWSSEICTCLKWINIIINIIFKLTSLMVINIETVILDYSEYLDKHMTTILLITLPT